MKRFNEKEFFKKATKARVKPEAVMPFFIHHAHKHYANQLAIILRKLHGLSDNPLMIRKTINEELAQINSMMKGSKDEQTSRVSVE